MATTTVGKVLLKHYLPVELKHFADTTLDKKGIAALFMALSKYPPEVYRDVVSKLSLLGFEASTQQGSTVSIDDLLPTKDKDARFDALEKGIHTIKHNGENKKSQNASYAELYKNFTNDFEKHLLDTGLKENKTLAKVILSGARGSIGQYRRTVGAVGLVNDEHNNPSYHFPIRHSFAEGLSPAEYLTHGYDERRGVVTGKLNVADSGALAKQINRAALTVRVEEHDCGTHKGVPVSSSDRDYLGCYLAQPIGGYNYNNEITPSMLGHLKDKHIDEYIVRSPISCEASKNSHHGAVCAMCVGKREKGLLSKGDYVGVNVSGALSEPLTQVVLSSKHGGNAAGGFKALERVFNPPQEFPDHAPIARNAGLVKITKATQGGHNVVIGKDSYYVANDLDLKVKTGDHVAVGDVLSEGLVNPREITEVHGIGEGRKRWSKYLDDVFKKNNIYLNKRNFDLMSRATVDHCVITDPEGLKEHLPDEVTHYNAIEKDYKVRKDAVDTRVDKAIGKYLEQPVLHYTIGTKITADIADTLKKHGHQSVLVNDAALPFEAMHPRLVDIPSYEDDFFHNLYSTYLQRQLIHKVNTGAISSLTGASPILGLAKGVGFGSR